jgi:hypothetical protein
MPANNTGGEIDIATQRAVVSRMVDIGMEGLPTAHLRIALNSLDAHSVTAAIDSLVEAGVLRQEAGELFPSPPLVRLDVLGLVPV